MHLRMENTEDKVGLRYSLHVKAIRLSDQAEGAYSKAIIIIITIIIVPQH